MNPYLKNNQMRDTFKKSRKQVSNKRKIKNVKKEVSVITGLIFALLISLFIWQDPHRINQLIDKIEFHAMSMGEASEAGKNEPDQSKNVANKSPESKSSQKNDKAKTEAPVSGKDNYNENLAERKKDLDGREERLSELEKELHSKQLMVEEKLVELEKMRKSISSILKDRVEVDKMNVEKLVNYYSSMKPQSAAKVIEALEEPLAMTVLSQMKKQNAAAIMNNLPVEKAKKLTELLAGVH